MSPWLLPNTLVRNASKLMGVSVCCSQALNCDSVCCDESGKWYYLGAMFYGFNRSIAIRFIATPLARWLTFYGKLVYSAKFGVR